jgi:hypothetical protein
MTQLAPIWPIGSVHTDFSNSQATCSTVVVPWFGPEQWINITSPVMLGMKTYHCILLRTAMSSHQYPNVSEAAPSNYEDKEIAGQTTPWKNRITLMDCYLLCIYMSCNYSVLIIIQFVSVESKWAKQSEFAYMSHRNVTPCDACQFWMSPILTAVQNLDMNKSQHLTTLDNHLTRLDNQVTTLNMMQRLTSIENQIRVTWVNFGDLIIEGTPRLICLDILQGPQLHCLSP